MTNKWWADIPDAGEWQPRPVPTPVASALRLTCRKIEARLRAEATAERDFNIDNYDSGPGIEDLVRAQIERILPARYAVARGVLSDRAGRTAGDCDLLILNRTWMPAIKLGATGDSRRWHYPIESAYAVMEIKQTATVTALDEAMEKLVCCHRLNRPMTPYGQISENTQVVDWDLPNHRKNPLASFIVAIEESRETSFSDLARRFVLINDQLPLDEKVHGLIVLGAGIVSYYVATEHGLQQASFMFEDRVAPLTPCRADTKTDSFYHFFLLLSGHLNRSILRASDILSAYGSSPGTVFPLDRDEIAAAARELDVTRTQ